MIYLVVCMETVAMDIVIVEEVVLLEGCFVVDRKAVQVVVGVRVVVAGVFALLENTKNNQVNRLFRLISRKLPC